ncbi:MAG: DegT/DnrJ/EryC1/StrS family aminotransferase [Lachnospiraceae bacterium]|nr:DegT/DnrJ/EryC1/StrS family aminotransferase [Lachnospiraceae bacterium]
MTINVTRSSLPELEEYMEEIRSIWESHWLTNMGVKHDELQAELERFLNMPHVTLFTNGHLALETALAALDLPKGGEVITTPFTFVSTTHAITRNGLVPVFADIDPVSYTLDPKKAEALITDKTVAILPVHVYGRLCDVDAFAKLAKKYDLKLIYDAAHAFAVFKDGKSSADFGDLSMYSFHATKVFHTIEGGALCYRDDALVQRLNDLKNFGIRGPEDCAYIGGNAKMSEFQAAMGLCNLRHLDREIGLRKLAADRYNERLGGVPGIRLSAPQPGVTQTYAYYPVIFDGYKYTRDEIDARLRAEGIVPRKYFYPLTNDYRCYADLPTAGKEKTPIAAYIADRVLTIPIYSGLKEEEVDRICDVILN